MKTAEAPYSRDELSRAEGTDPHRGPMCPKCGRHVPEFADLLDADRQRILGLIRAGRRIVAVHELKTCTGCPLKWAELWVEHNGRADALGTTAACPYCGEPLKTALAKQCLHCAMDWHDPCKPKKLVEGK